MVLRFEQSERFIFNDRITCHVGDDENSPKDDRMAKATFTQKVDVASENYQAMQSNELEKKIIALKATKKGVDANYKACAEVLTERVRVDGYVCELVDAKKGEREAVCFDNASQTSKDIGMAHALKEFQAGGWVKLLTASKCHELGIDDAVIKDVQTFTFDKKKEAKQ